MSKNTQSVVIVKNLYKTFKLPHEQASGIKQVIINFAKRKKGYEQQKVLKDISFEIKKGEFFGIVGRNGSGKSTLLKLLAGIYAPDEGLVQVNGSLTPFIELGVGFNHELTGRENVFMNGALLGFSRHEMELMYDDIVGFAELEKFMDQKLKNYSSGMQVRLAFSIAIRANSDILLIDEVLAVGDANFQKKCFDTFIELKKQKRTIILVTHDMANVEAFCDRALVLDAGKIIYLGKPEQAAQRYAKINIAQRPQVKESAKEEEVNRWGDGGVSVQRVSLNGHLALTSPSVSTGEDLTIDVKVKYTGVKEPIVVGLAIHNEHNINVTGPNSKKLIINKDQPEDFTCVIKKLRLTAGEYKLTVALFNTELTKSYDFLDRYYRFNVTSDHIVHGLVELDYDWSAS